jgi:hypothetical protein
MKSGDHNKSQRTKQMKRFILIFTSAVYFLSACGGTGDIEAHNAWIRPTAQGENAAVYFQLDNHTQNADELIGASSNIADIVEIHESKMENDVMQMNMVPTIQLGVDDEVIFAPGGYHIMLISVEQELKSGDHIGVILHFRDHEDLVINVSVGDNAMDMENGNHQ